MLKTIDHVNIVVRDLARARDFFCSGIQTYPATGKKLIYCRGPEGIVLELAQYP